MNITFGINDYDRDGDLVEKGIWLYFDEQMYISMKVSNDFKGYKKFIEDLDRMKSEIEEAWNEHNS